MSAAATRTTGQDHLWSVDEHLKDILATVQPLEPIELNLLDAQGCVLVDDVTVPLSLPPFDNSSMDGYAVRVADVKGANKKFPAVLTVIGDVAAGSADLLSVEPGQAARIMTGAPLPPGAQAVVPVEWTDAGAGEGPAATMTAHSAACPHTGTPYIPHAITTPHRLPTVPLATGEYPSPNPVAIHTHIRLMPPLYHTCAPLCSTVYDGISIFETWEGRKDGGRDRT